MLRSATRCAILCLCAGTRPVTGLLFLGALAWLVCLRRNAKDLSGAFGVPDLLVYDYVEAIAYLNFYF